MPLDSSAYPREMLRCQWLERTADVLKMLRSLRPPSMGSKILRPKPTCRGVGWRSDLTVTPRRTVGLQVWIFLALFVYVCVYLSLKYYHSKYAMCVNVACYLKQYQTDSGYTKVLCFSCTQSHKKKCKNGSEWFTHQWTNDICILILKKKAPLEKINAPLLVSPWLADRHQASERERELERLVFMLVNHTSHTDLKSPVSDCPLCEKVGGLWVVRIISLCCWCSYQCHREKEITSGENTLNRFICLCVLMRRNLKWVLISLKLYW